MTKLTHEERRAKAKAYMEKLDKNIDKVEVNTKKYLFQNYSDTFHSIYILAHKNSRFAVFIFFNTEKQVNEIKLNDSFKTIEDFVYTELEKQGRGKREEINVNFEYDSHENVVKNYEGDYYLRLR